MRTAQVAVVGGGPAGLSAAIAAAQAGAQTVLLDEQPAPGGQLRYRLGPVPDHGDRSLSGPALAERLTAGAEDAGVRLCAGAVAWGLFEGRTLTVVHGAESYQLRAGRIILATGSTDLALPFPGATLPGVMTARALLILLHCHRVRPGRRFAIVGTGPDADEVAVAVDLAGGEVVATGAGHDLHVAGPHGVTEVTLDGTRASADIVVLALGRQPDPELALMAECGMAYAEDAGGWIPVLDENLQTTVAGIAVAGDATGICTIPEALAEGRFAGQAAAASLGLLAPDAHASARAAYEATCPERVARRRRQVPTYAQVERDIAGVTS